MKMTKLLLSLASAFLATSSVFGNQDQLATELAKTDGNPMGILAAPGPQGRLPAAMAVELAKSDGTPRGQVAEIQAPAEFGRRPAAVRPMKFPKGMEQTDGTNLADPERAP